MLDLTNENEIGDESNESDKDFDGLLESPKETLKQKLLDDHSIEPNRTNVLLMVCPGTRVGAFIASLGVLRSAEFSNYTVCFASDDLQARNIIAKSGSGDLTAALEQAKETTIKWMKEAKSKIQEILENRFTKYKTQKNEEANLDELIIQLIEQYSYAPEQLNNLERDILFWHKAPETLKSWDEMITIHSKYDQYQKEILNRYKTDSEFQFKMDASINGFMEKYCKDKDQDSVKETKRFSCLEYKVREIAGLYVKREIGIHLVLYEGSLCPVLNFVLAELSKKEPSLRFRAIDSKQKKLMSIIILSEEDENMKEVHKGIRKVSEEVTGGIQGSATYYPSEDHGGKKNAEKQASIGSSAKGYPTYFKPGVPQDAIFDEIRLMISQSHSIADASLLISNLMFLLTEEQMKLTMAQLQKGQSNNGRAKQLNQEINADKGITYEHGNS